MKLLALAMFNLLLCMAVAPSSASVHSQGTIELTISGIETKEGRLALGVFKNQADFKAETAYTAFKFSKEGVDKDGALTVSFQLPAGTYGLSMLDDENDNDGMDYNFFGIPTEGFGFSDYYHRGLRKPKFKSFQFDLAANEHRKITIKMRYII